MRGRYRQALGFALAVQAVLPPLLCATVSALTVHRMLNPLSLLAHWYQPVLSLSWLTGLVLPCLCLCVLHGRHVLHYTVSSSHPVKLWQHLLLLLSPAHHPALLLLLSCSACLLLTHTAR